MKPIVWPPLTGDVHQTWPGKRWWQKPGPWCRTKARLGRRGAMLLSMGVLYVLIGYGEIARDQAHYAGAYHLFIPDWVRCVLWVGSGIAGSYFAFQRHHSSDEAKWWQTDTYGWFMLWLPPLMRVTSYAGSWLTWLLSGWFHFPWVGASDAWVPMAIYCIPITFVIICSGWVENPRREFCP